MKIKQIAGLMLDKKDDSEIKGHTFNEGKVVGFNEAIEEQGEVEIDIDIDYLAKLLFEDNQRRLYSGDIVTWEEALKYVSFPISEWRDKAIFISKNLSDLLKGSDI